jgi:hypothetical protein
MGFWSSIFGGDDIVDKKGNKVGETTGLGGRKYDSSTPTVFNQKTYVSGKEEIRESKLVKTTKSAVKTVAGVAIKGQFGD